MQEQERDMEQILLVAKKVGMFMDPAVKLMGIGTIMLLTRFARMVKEGKLSRHEFKDFQDFAKLTEGKFTIMNLPVANEGTKWIGQHGLQKEFKELQRLGIRYSLLPDLDPSDAYLQIAIMDEDKEKFSVWYEAYLTKKLSGGEHTLENLKSLTQNHISIISLPLEGSEQIFREDFQALGINYAILPDLKVGDGQLQMMVADHDLQKVEHWYKLHQEDVLKEGVELPDLNQIDMTTYQKTGEMSSDDYIATENSELKALNQKYDQAAGTLETSYFAKESLIKSDESTIYEAFENDLRYQKFTINAETLVTPVCETVLGKREQKAMMDNGYFLSRVPGTYGKNVNYLLVPNSQVFCSKDQKTYTAFLKKDQKPILFDGKFQIVHYAERKSTEELFRTSYDLSQREKELTQSIRGHVPEQIKKSMKAPSVPVKVR